MIGVIGIRKIGDKYLSQSYLAWRLNYNWDGQVDILQSKEHSAAMTCWVC